MIGRSCRLTPTEGMGVLLLLLLLKDDERRIGLGTRMGVTGPRYRWELCWCEWAEGLLQY